MTPWTRLLLTALLLPAAAPLLFADRAADYAALTAGLTQVTGSGGTPGTVVVLGRNAFPLFSSQVDGTDPVAAAGYHLDDTNAARGLAYSHTGWASTNGTQGTALLNAVQWATHGKAGAVVGIGANLVPAPFFTSRGLSVKAVSTGMSSASTDLGGVDVFLMNVHSGYSSNALARTRAFLSAGGGVLVFATPWALSSAAFKDANDLLLLLRLAYANDYQSGGPFTVSSSPFPAYASALSAGDALLADHAGQLPLTLADKRLCADVVDAAIAARPDFADLNHQVQALSDAYGWLNVTSAFSKTSRPVDAMLVRYQSKQLDVLPPAALPAALRPTAARWPGLPAPGALPVTRTVQVKGDSPPPDPALINQGGHGLRLPLGLYAAPGAVLRVVIPEDKVSRGLRTQIGVHHDENFHLDPWQRHPKVVRYDDLTRVTNEVGSAWGGLLFLRVPPGQSLGTFPVTIEGALEAPHFVDGVDTDADWRLRLRDLPGAWGYIQTSNMTVYASRAALQRVPSAQRVAAFWGAALAQADHTMGYLRRYREEAAVTDLQISVGYGHAGYPVLMEYGDSDLLVEGITRTGDWGFYHELGHTFQDDGHGWSGTSGGEVDVNLLPNLLMTLTHGRSLWDNNTHSTMDAANRWTARQSFFATPLTNRAWSAISGGGNAAAYDFYFNLVESFGYDLWRSAFSRFYRWSTNNASEPAFAGLDLHHRWFVALCEATGHNLAPYFDNYGWPLTNPVKARFASLPPWTENRPPTRLRAPANLTLGEDTPPGTVVTTFAVDDPDPGNLFVYGIAAGNEEGAFTLDRWTGELRVAALDYERRATHTLTITVFDNALPRYFLTNTLALSILNAAEPPRLRASLFTASATTPAGTILGTPGVTLEAGRTVARFELEANDPRFQLDHASGAMRVQQASLLPNPGLVTLGVRVTDSAGATGRGTVLVLCNQARGVLEQRWPGTTTAGAPAVSNLLTAFPTASVGDNYTRRLSAWIVPPVGGGYTFWIASDDESTLQLSPGGLRDGRFLAASVSGYTSVSQWDQQASQQSRPVQLEAGQPCYLEVVHHEGGGSDHVAVAWREPGGTRVLLPQALLIPGSLPYEPPAPPPLMLWEHQAGHGLRVWFPALEARLFAIETSTDLLEWVPQSTNTVSGGLFQMLRPTLQAQEFLRARLVP